MGRAGPQPPQAQRPHVYSLHGAPGGLGPHLILTQELKQLSSLLPVAGSLSFELTPSLVPISSRGRRLSLSFD